MTTADPVVDTDALAWIPLRPGVAFRPLRFARDGYTLQLRVEPGAIIGRHRHTGEVHAYTVSGARELIEAGTVAGAGSYVYEPPGNVDSWRCVGAQPCIVQITLTGRVEYLDAHGAVEAHSDSDTARGAYLDWCRRTGIAPASTLGLAPDGSLAT
ncbi:MAG: cupin domain-containing protein [Proteobacteria bacterium]|nr:cupin domain-containing protein [Pseudomonadota bacterium]